MTEAEKKLHIELQFATEALKKHGAHHPQRCLKDSVGKLMHCYCGLSQALERLGVKE